MKKNIDKVLVLITFSVFITTATVLFWINNLNPKNMDLNNGLLFGNKRASIKLVIFEDFTCEHCKEFSYKNFPEIKKKYIDTNKISYEIVPLAFLYGSKDVTNAAIIIYEMNKSSFWEFLKVISEKRVNIETKEDLVEIVKNIQGINVDIFKRFLKKEIYNKYLEKNLVDAKKVLKPFQVPSIYLNGNLVKKSEISGKIDELIVHGKK